LGDDGGGYWLGVQAVRAALAARDGTGPATRLGEALSEHYQKDLDGIVARVYADPIDRRELSGFVPVLARVAEIDTVAASLLSYAAEHLIALVRAVTARLPAGLPVASVGGVFRVDAIRERVVAATSAVPPGKPPELGAVWLAERRSDLRMEIGARESDAT
jgi:N-acetylglucosamine kinase-like BadF-type ATPase